MKIKHTKCACGPDGSFNIGTERDTDNPADNLSLESAKQLVAGGYADDITPRATTPSPAAAEAAAEAPAPEPIVPQPQSSRHRKTA